MQTCVCYVSLIAHICLIPTTSYVRCVPLSRATSTKLSFVYTLESILTPQPILRYTRLHHHTPHIRKLHTHGIIYTAGCNRWVRRGATQRNCYVRCGCRVQSHRDRWPLRFETRKSKLLRRDVLWWRIAYRKIVVVVSLSRGFILSVSCCAYSTLFCDSPGSLIQ